MRIRLAILVYAGSVFLALGCGAPSAVADSVDNAFLDELKQLGVAVYDGEGAGQAIQAGRGFCSALRSGASQPQAHQILAANYPKISYDTLYKTAAAANLVYCPETLP